MLDIIMIVLVVAIVCLIFTTVAYILCLLSSNKKQSYSLRTYTQCVVCLGLFDQAQITEDKHCVSCSIERAKLLDGVGWSLTVKEKIG